MMTVENEMSEVSNAVKEREKKIRELGKAVAAKGDTNDDYTLFESFILLWLLLLLLLIICICADWPLYLT